MRAHHSVCGVPRVVNTTSRHDAAIGTHVVKPIERAPFAAIFLELLATSMEVGAKLQRWGPVAALAVAGPFFFSAGRSCFDVFHVGVCFSLVSFLFGLLVSVWSTKAAVSDENNGYYRAKRHHLAREGEKRNASGQQVACLLLSR